MNTRNRRNHLKWINNISLFLKSRLDKTEKRLMKRVLETYDKNNNYIITNYLECTMLVKITYKLDDRMSYLFNREKTSSDEYQQIKTNNKILNLIVKEYAKTSEM